MKKLFTLLTVMAVSYAVSAQNTAATATSEAKPAVQDPHAGHNHAAGAHDVAAVAVPETISFGQTEHDFGKIPQGKPVTYTFEFKNGGTGGLKLDNVQASCGCTTPEWSKDEVAAGSTSKITVGYNAAAEGPFQKTITVTYNGGASKTLTIKGEVWKTPATSAPENNSLNNLKN